MTFLKAIQFDCRKHTVKLHFVLEIRVYLNIYRVNIRLGGGWWSIAFSGIVPSSTCFKFCPRHLHQILSGPINKMRIPEGLVISVR